MLSLFQPFDESGEKSYPNQSLEVCYEEARTFSAFRRFFSVNLKLRHRMEEKETVLKAGTAHWHTADEHSVENVGETLAHYLIFEFKK